MVEYVKLGDVIHLISGRDLLSTQYNEDKIGIPYITGASNIDGSSVVINRWTNEPAVISHQNDILLTCKGTVGLVAMNDFGDCHLARQLMALRPNNESIDRRYLKYFIESQSKYLSSEAKSMIPGISREDVLSLPFPIRLISEQQHVAKVLDAVGALIAKRKQQIALLDDAVKSLFVEMFGDPVENPMGWATLAFAEVFDISSSKRILKSEWKSEGIPFLRVRDMVQLATTGTLDNEFSVSEQFYASLQDSDGIPQKGDILVSATSTLGKCHIVADGERFYFKDADVLRFRPKKNINPVYFIELMDTEYIKRQIAQTLGITTVSHFTIVSAKKIHLRLPPLELQKEFAARVEKIETQRRRLEVGLAKMEEAYGALMQEYFE